MQHPRLNSMRRWVRTAEFFEQYADYAQRMDDEELANLAITLCHQVIYLLGQLLKTQQERFVTHGGIKEQMHTARTGYRKQQDELLAKLQQENNALRQQIAQLEKQIKELTNQTTPITQITPNTQTTQTTPINQKNQPTP